MVRKLAIDWDEIELRLVAAQGTGSSVKITDAAVIPVENGNVINTLRAAIEQRGLEHTETLIAIGRGKAELRELKLPPVPDDELPDMVRFQAIRSFASAGDSATVDYLVTHRDDSAVNLIAAAVGPDKLNEIRKTGAAVDLNVKRVSLRPLSAAALYLIHHASTAGNDTVLIDLLAHDAEIVIAREGRVIFVRTVRMPSSDAARGKALAGELRRSLVACGSTGSLERVVLWGRQSVHTEDVQMLAEASGSSVDVIDPFEVADTDQSVKSGLPEHIGRLAPLVGLLVADELAPERLVDFLNPRQRVEETTSPYRTALIAGIPAAVVLLLGYLLFSHLQGLDRQIAELKSINAGKKPGVEAAQVSVAKTDKIDAFLDQDVNWLAEIRRLSELMPPSDKLIVRSITGTTGHLGVVEATKGGGTLQVAGAVTQPSVISKFVESLQDESHRVTSGDTKPINDQDGYNWEFDGTITINGDWIKNLRYDALRPPPIGAAAAPDEEAAEPVPPTASTDASQQPDSTAEQTEVDVETESESSGDDADGGENQQIRPTELAVDRPEEVQS